MSKYTTEVRYICESLNGLTESSGFNDVETIITEAAPKIFSFNFPIFDEAYRLPLERKILRHYYTREISEETYGLWKLRLDDRMNVIMPYYNQLYQSALLTFNPLMDVDLTTDHSGSGNNVMSGDSEDKSVRNRTNENDFSEVANENASKSGNNNRTKSGSNTDEISGRNDVYNGEDEVRSDSMNREENKTNNFEKEYGSETNENRNVDYEGSNSGVSNSERNSKEENSGATHNEGSNTNWELFSDTPQGGVNGLSGVTIGTLEDQLFLSTAKKTTNENEDDGTSSGTNKTDESASNVTTGSENSNTKDVSSSGVEGSEGSTTTEENKSQEENTGVRNKTGYSNGTNQETKTTEFGEENNDTFNEENSLTGIKNQNNSGKEQEDMKNNRIENRVVTTTDEYLQRISGKSGGMTYSAMLMEYRDSFINIDEMIIEELSDLFFGLW